MASEERRVLVTGGTGYLGQFIVKAFAQHPALRFQVALTYFSRPPEASALQTLGNPSAFKVDLRTGQGLEEYSSRVGPPDLVVNCAAISVPREYDENPDDAMAINVPTCLVDWLLGLNTPRPPLLVHLSTDQVYEGTKLFNLESDDCTPVNTYGRTKLAAERLIQQKWRNFAILRSSIIVGPPTPVPIPKQLPLQWMDSVLSQGQQKDFFADEFRSPVYVFDIVNIVLKLAAMAGENSSLCMQHLFNVGGPNRLSRAAMASLLAYTRGYDVSLINATSAASAINRGVNSPADISMDISRVISALKMELTPYVQAVKLSLAPSIA
eukprot:TRINITY_DN2422_c0_g1_i1.p1 TRINITY_DN2422_c0_g1~~TRINITY_DN2422_c0_g1_i1.p1  ORF type:complete len:345 (-),score=84.00 TRINITY_DN2422_c0_g1_i1:53-1024(-)